MKAKKKGNAQQIVDDFRRRIEAGALQPGDALASTRQLAAKWGVAIATVTKALLALQHEGLIQSKPRVGSVVAPRRQARAKVEPEDELTRERIVQVAVALADAEGLVALSMRGVAAKLDTPTMSLYRHVPSRDALVELMTDAVFAAEPLPEPSKKSWRTQLERWARALWRLFQRHPWLAQAMTLTRPRALRHVIRHADRTLAIFDGLGLDAVTTMHLHTSLYGYVQGIAVNLEAERQAQSETGLDEDAWVAAQAADFEALMNSGEVPTFARTLRALKDGFDGQLETVFEFGLSPLLDGFAQLIRRKQRRR